MWFYKNFTENYFVNTSILSNEKEKERARESEREWKSKHYTCHEKLTNVRRLAFWFWNLCVQQGKVENWIFNVASVCPRIDWHTIAVIVSNLFKRLSNWLPNNEIRIYRRQTWKWQNPMWFDRLTCDSASSAYSQSHERTRNNAKIYFFLSFFFSLLFCPKV